jgi:beta-1,4-N-acetylglucosaminyltransferase
MKFCIVCSPGGHFDEMARLLGAFEKHEYFLVTYKSESIINFKNVYLIESRYLKRAKSLYGLTMLLIKTSLEAIKIILREKPDVIFSTGGGEIAIPFCYLGKMLGKKVIYIESLANITSCSGGGRYVYPIADLFLVQWQSLLKVYGNKAKYWGKII